MNDFSEESLKANCPHCDPESFALKYPLEETENFWVVCDVHPLIEGHVLIIPKKHLSSIGEYPDHIYNEFVDLYNTFSNFIKTTYGSISTFEHGKIGQTVFHSHVHLLPFNGGPEEIVPEGKECLKEFIKLGYLKEEFREKGAYLFFSIEERNWVVDIKIGAPRFFRDRFAKALGVPERGNWKEMDKDEKLMEDAVAKMTAVQKKWSDFNL